jgi:uncharacterized protein YukE
MNEFQLDPDQIRGHATTLGEVADQLSGIGAGLPGGLGADALGTFVSFLATGLTGAMSGIGDAITHASSSVDEMRTGLTQTADDYRRADDANATNLTREYS